MKTNRILIGQMAFVLVVVIATSGYMLGYASGQTGQPVAVTTPPETKAPAALPVATDTPEKSAASGDNDAQPTAPEDQSLFQGAGESEAEDEADKPAKCQVLGRGNQKVVDA